MYVCIYIYIYICIRIMINIFILTILIMIPIDETPEGLGDFWISMAYIFGVQGCGV